VRLVLYDPEGVDVQKKLLDDQDSHDGENDDDDTK
jgi:hypothetical protein